MKYKYTLALIFLSIFCVPIIYFKLVQKHERVNNRPIVIVTIPKSGTHLLLKCIEHLTDKKARWSGFPNAPRLLEKNIEELLPNEFLVTHLPYGNSFEDILKKHNALCILNIRDPRDQIVSFAHFVHDDNFDQWWFRSESTIQENITSLISNGDIYYLWPAQHGLCKNVNDFYTSFLGWQNCPLFLTIKFENLVGPQGGGSDQTQEQSIKQIATHLGIEANNKLIKDISQKLFGGTETFRKGTIGSWKEAFSNEQKKRFMDIADKLLVKLDY